MKINYIADIRLPTVRASGYAIMKMCEKFSENTVSVNLVVPNRKNNEDGTDPFDYYKINRNFSIKKILSTDLLGNTLKFGKLFYWIDLFTFLFSLKFTKEISRNDIVYTRDYIIPMVFSKKYFLCLELHSVPSNRLLFKFAIKNVKLFVVLNKYIESELIELGISKDKILISPSGVEIADFDINIGKKEAREKIGLPVDKNIIIYTGHLYHWKGADTLAETAKIMPEKIFVFVGGVEPEISNFKYKYGDCKNIIIVPFVERSKIPMYLKSADILVLPNLAGEKISSDYTSPLKMFEYMASKRPIIASDLPSMRQILNYDNAFFAKQGNHDSVAEKINEIFSNSFVSEEKVAQAWNDVQNYSWKLRAECIISFIKK